MAKMRIAIWHNLPSGGGKRQLYYHVKGLVERGHYVESWCPDTADQDFLPLNELVKEHVVPLKFRDDNFSNPRRPYRATRALIQAFEEQCRECAEEINRGDFDLLYANSCRYLRTTPIAKYVAIPSVMYLGEPFRWFYEAMPELPWIAPPRQESRESGLAPFKELLQRFLTWNTISLQARAELEFARAFDLVLTNSVYSRESILRSYNLDSSVCYLGVDTDFYRPLDEAKENLVVGLGTIYHGKGIDRAIRAVGAIPAAKRPQLVWIGNGASESDLRSYQELARHQGVDFDTRIHIPDGEVISLLRRARLMLYTSRLEPFGLAPLEANACGTPVVGIAEGGVKETVRDGVNGYLAINDDPDALASLMLKLLDSPAHAQEMGAAARQYVERQWNLGFGTDNIERALFSLYEKKGGSTLRNIRIEELQDTGDVRLNVEQKELVDKQLRIKGWAFIEDGNGAANASIFLTIQAEGQSRIVAMKPDSRPDVTRHFRGSVDYDTSGFSLQCALPESAPQLGLLIIRNQKVAFKRL